METEVELNARKALLSLATKESLRGNQQLDEDELDILERNAQEFHTLPDSRITYIIKRAIKCDNYNLVERLLTEIGTGEQCLQDEPGILREYISQGRGDLRSGREPSADSLFLLLAHGALPHSTDHYGRTPLFHAATHGFFRTFNLLIRAGAPVDSRPFQNVQNSRTRDCSANLLQIAWYHWFPVGPYYYVHGASFRGWWDVSDDRRFRCAEDQYAKIWERLLDLGVTIDTAEPEWEIMCGMLCYLGDAPRLRALIDRGVPLESAGLHAGLGSLLHAAVCGGNIDTIKLLLDFGLDPRQRRAIPTNTGWPPTLKPATPMEAAVQRMHALTRTDHLDRIYTGCEWLLDADIGEYDRQVLLECCIRKQWTRRTLRLLQRGMRLEQIPPTTDEPIIDMLLQHGARMDGPAFVRHAFEQRDPSFLADLLEKYSIVIDRSVYEDIVLGFLPFRDRNSYFRTQHEVLLDLLLDHLGLSIEEIFHRKLEWHEPGYKTMTNPDDLDCPNHEPAMEKTTLLRLACKHRYFSLLRWLLTVKHADASCPGFPDIALRYVMTSSTDYQHGHLEDIIDLLEEHSKYADVVRQIG